MPEIHSIRTLYARGCSKCYIAKLLHVGRNTVDKYTAPDYVVESQPKALLEKPRPAPKMDP